MNKMSSRLKGRRFSITLLASGWEASFWEFDFWRNWRFIYFAPFLPIFTAQAVHQRFSGRPFRWFFLGLGFAGGHGSSIPKSRQIFRARKRLTSVWRGTAERRFGPGFSHHEWLAPSRTSRSLARPDGG
jgi:hypothetical protein